MSIKDRKGVEIKIGDLLEHVSHNLGGQVVSLDPDRLPLIGLDCNTGTIRWIPWMELKHV